LHVTELGSSRRRTGSCSALHSDDGAAILGEVTGKSGSRRGGSATLGDGWRKNPLSAMAARSASSEDDDAGERLKGSPVSGVTGLLSVRDGKSSTLGDRISPPALRGDGGRPIANGAIILRFFMLLRLSYSLNDGFLGRHGPLAAWPAPVAAAAAASFLLAGCCGSPPVSIWTTCLKEVVSAWTKVVGKGVVSMVRGTGRGDGGRLWVCWAARWCCGCDGEVEEDDEEEVEDDGELGSC
jgi:hypothetical protein